MELNSTTAVLLIGLVLLFIGLVGGRVDSLGFKTPQFGFAARMLSLVAGLLLSYFSLDRLDFVPPALSPARLGALLQDRQTITITDSLARYQRRETIDLLIDGSLAGTLVLDRDKGVLSDSIVVSTNGKPIAYQLRGVELDRKDGAPKTRMVRGEGQIVPVAGGVYEFQPRGFTETEVVEYIRLRPQ
jgi:hypothetical protein